MHSTASRLHAAKSVYTASKDHAIATSGPDLMIHGKQAEVGVSAARPSSEWNVKASFFVKHHNGRHHMGVDVTKDCDEMDDDVLNAWSALRRATAFPRLHQWRAR